MIIGQNTWGIRNVWEVRLAQKTWEKILLASKIQNTTLSWIVRYCTFKVVLVEDLGWQAFLKKAYATVKAEDRGQMHRHMLCLYGDDEKLLRLAALELGISITDLVRIAIELHVECLLSPKRPADWFSRGIKVVTLAFPIGDFIRNTKVWHLKFYVWKFH